MALKGIDALISTTVLKVLGEMSHGDEIVLADAHFPSHSICPPQIPVVRADGTSAPALLATIIPLFELDTCDSKPVIMMDIVKGDSTDPSVEILFREALAPEYQGEIERLEMFAFIERAKGAFASVMAGEKRKYGNVILKKGVTPMN